MARSWALVADAVPTSDNNRFLGLCGACIIRRGGTDNCSHGEPTMAVIIRREVALAPCGGLYYQTLGDR